MHKAIIKVADESYGWVICIACALLLFCTGGLASTGFSAYQPYLISIGGLTNTQSSTMIMFRTLFTLTGMTVTNRLISRFEVRRVVSTACFICAAAFFVFSISSDFILYCVGASLAGFALGAGGMIPVSIVISRWFNEHRGLALGICMAMTGVSAIAATPAITFMVQNLSLKTSFRIEAIFIALISVIVYAILYSNPACIGARPVGHCQKERAKLYASHDASRRLYLIMTAGIFLFGIPANCINSHISVLFAAAGMDSSHVALLISVTGIFMAAGKCTYGQLSDRLGVSRASLLLYCILLSGSGLLCFAEVESFAVSAIAAALTGFGLAITTVSISVYASKISTEAQYAHTVTRFQMGSTFGALVFGPVPGMIADSTGSYVPAFIILFLIALVSSAILLTTYHKIHREDALYPDGQNLSPAAGAEAQ